MIGRVALLALAVAFTCCNVPPELPPIVEARRSPTPTPALTPAQRQINDCARLCKSQGLRIQRVTTGAASVCECAPHNEQGPGAVDGVGLGIGIEVGRQITREFLR